MMLRVISLLDAREKRAFRLHLLYSLLDGVILGILALNEFVFIKSLGGTNYQLGVLFQFSVVVFLLLLFVNEFIRRISNKHKLIRIVGVISRVPLLVFLFFPRSPEMMQNPAVCHFIFLGAFLFYYLSTPVIYPAINLLLKNSYQNANFGKLYSYSTSANKFILILVTFLYGFLLDINNFIFIYIIPAAAVISMASVWLLSGIEFTEQRRISKRSLFQSVGSSVKNMLDILKRDAPFRHFEIAFMIYGFAFMITVTVIILFYDKVLQLNYSSVAFYKNGYYLLSIILLPFFGKLIGKIDPRKFGMYTFASMLLFIFFLMITEYFPIYVDFMNISIYYLMIFYVIFQGVFGAMIILIWYIGSAYFCSRSEAASYQEVHLFLTGVRGIFAPLLGIYFYEQFGFSITFVIAMLLLFIASGVMYWSHRKYKVADSNPSPTPSQLGRGSTSPP